MQAIQPSSNGHRPLAHHARLDHLPVACMAVRAGSAACQQCADACPADALLVDSDGPHLTGDCLGCGRCAVACPTGAMACRGFDVDLAVEGLAPVRVECQRVPPATSGAGTRVPCLGGIAPAQLLEWAARAPSRPIYLIDRGGCAQCAAGTGHSPIDELLDGARPWLKACGVPDALWPTRMPEAAPSRWLPLGHASQEPALSRRGFFRRITSEVGQPCPTAAVPSGPRAQLRASPAPVPARERWLAALGNLAERQGLPLPPAALFRLDVDDRCQGHGLCTGNCPSGALQQLGAQGAVELWFDATRCVGCDRCTSACPERAITLSASGRPDQALVHRIEQRQCVSCGDAFGAAKGSQALCPRCRQSQDLARSLFGPSAGMGVAEM